jgi:uncharacterized protein (TIGR03067 family)
MIVLTLLLLANVSDDKPQDDRDRIQGPWAVTAAEVDGQAVTPDSAAWKGFKDLKLTFRGDRVSNPLIKQEGLFALDSRVTPHTLDMIVLKDGKSKVLALLYELDGDTLRLCLPIDPDKQDRPKEFTSKMGQIILTLKRGKE